MRLRATASIALLAVLAPTPLLAKPASPPAPAQSAQFIGTAINVADRERSLRFYTQALGLHLATTISTGKGSETILQFPGSPGQPALLLMHDSTPGAPAAMTHGNGFSRLVLRVTDLAMLAARMDQLGYAHGAMRQAGQAGYSIMMANDPDGYRLELIQQVQPQTGS
jgi:lactoylglutathione lyase